MSDEINATRNRFFDRLKHSALEYAAVIMAAVAILIAAFSMLFGGVAMYIAIDAQQTAEVYKIYANNLHAELRANEFKPPPLPEE